MVGSSAFVMRPELSMPKKYLKREHERMKPTLAQLYVGIRLRYGVDERGGNHKQEALSEKMI